MPAPSPREPRPRQKANGAWFVRWGGKDHYLSIDGSEAKKLWSDPASRHPGSHAAWLRWKAGTAAALRALSPSRRDPDHPHAPGAMLVANVAEMLFQHYLTAGRPGTAAYYRTHMARFLTIHGRAALLAMATPSPDRHVYLPPVVPLLNAFKQDLLRPQMRLEHRTVNHDLGAVKRLFNFAADQGLCPSVNWRAVRRAPVPPPEPEELTPRVLMRVFRIIHRREPLLLPYLALNYLCLARPSEVVELVCSVKDPAAYRVEGHHRRRPPRPRDPARRGRFLAVKDEHGRVLCPRGLFELRRHKHSWRSGVGGAGPIPRYLVLSDQALAWLDLAVPIWSTLDSYSSACSRAMPGFGPRMLRDSGASHLRARGVALADVQTLLGHVQDGEWPSYVRVAWPALRSSAALLAM